MATTSLRPLIPAAVKRSEPDAESYEIPAMALENKDLPIVLDTECGPQKYGSFWDLSYELDLRAAFSLPPSPLTQLVQAVRGHPLLPLWEENGRRAYAMASFGDIKAANQISACRLDRVLYRHDSIDNVLPVAVRCDKDRLCALCSRQNARKRTRKLVPLAMDLLQQGCVLQRFTLTAPVSTIHLGKCAKRWTQDLAKLRDALLKLGLRFGIRGVDVVCHADHEHVHAHVVIVVERTLTEELLTVLWQAIRPDSRNPVRIDESIGPFAGAPTPADEKRVFLALLYTAKSAITVKEADDLCYSRWARAQQELRGAHLFSVWGPFDTSGCANRKRKNAICREPLVGALSDGADPTLAIEDVVNRDRPHYQRLGRAFELLRAKGPELLNGEPTGFASASLHYVVQDLQRDAEQVRRNRERSVNGDYESTDRPPPGRKSGREVVVSETFAELRAAEARGRRHSLYRYRKTSRR